STAGGVLGLAVAAASIRGLLRLVPPDAPFVEQIALDSRVLLAAAAIGAFTVILIGLLPALSASGVHVMSALKEGGRGSSQGRKTGRPFDHQINRSPDSSMLFVECWTSCCTSTPISPGS
ncbi:MAG: hypothetical protein ACRD1H_19235, partial [Vicinamibacterales bacterium]